MAERQAEGVRPCPVTLHHLSVSAEPYPVPAVRCGLQIIGKPHTTGSGPRLWGTALAEAEIRVRSIQPVEKAHLRLRNVKDQLAADLRRLTQIFNSKEQSAKRIASLRIRDH